MIQRADRQFAGLQQGGDMSVFLFHLLEQLGLFPRVADIGLPEDRR